MNGFQSVPPRLGSIWVLLRVPLLGIVLFAFRKPVVTLIERVFDISGVTVLAIGVLGTPLSRTLIFVLAALALFGLDFLAARWGTIRGYCATVAGMIGTIGVLLSQEAVTKRQALLLAVVCSTNFFPLSTLATRVPALGRAWDALAALGVGIAEVFFLRELVGWLSRTWCPWLETFVHTRLTYRALATIFPAGLLAVLTFQNGELFSLEQSFRMDPRVRRFAHGDYNWIQLDESGRHLFATGHSVERLERFDTTKLDEPPHLAKAPTGNAQGFGFDRKEGRVYVFDGKKGAILAIDAETLDLVGEIQLTDVSPGDPWLEFEPLTNTLTVLSEADEETGVPFQVVDRSTGRVIDKENEDPGNVLVDPTAPLLYLGYFRRSVGVRPYDLRTGEFGPLHETPGRPDRLAFWREQGEVLVALPTQSRVLRLKAPTLEQVGEFRTIFGVRTFAIDSDRQLLFCGSLATGALAILDLKTGKEMTRAYVSPWLRTIQVDTKQRIAYLSANGALYTFDYRALTPN